MGIKTYKTNLKGDITWIPWEYAIAISWDNHMGASPMNGHF